MTKFGKMMFIITIFVVLNVFPVWAVYEFIILPKLILAMPNVFIPKFSIFEVWCVMIAINKLFNTKTSELLVNEKPLDKIKNQFKDGE